jgi:hypothetical protein
MTGQRLVDLAKWPAGAKNKLDLTDAQYRDQQLAQMYIHGVHDSTEGKQWCYSDQLKPKPGTLEDYALNGLRALPAAELTRNASDLITAIWRAKLPCTPPRSAS